MNKKIVKVLFLIITFIVSMCKIAKAQGFWIEFTDYSGNGSIDFTLSVSSTASQDYYIGIADTDHSNLTQLLLIPAGGSNSTFLSWGVPPGGSLLYDIYLTPDNSTFYWTSEGDAVYKITGSGKKLYTYWLNGDITVGFDSTGIPGKKDAFAIVPVPLPSALWIFGSGIVALGLIRKKLLLN